MQRFLIIGLIVVIFLSFMVTYTVRFTDTAVVTTVGRADEGSVVREPGLRFKVPFVQRVTKYDTRARAVESAPETQQTSDQNPVVVSAQLVWRVSDPLKFYRRFAGAGRESKDHFKEAERILKSKLRSAMSEVSKFRLDQLLAGDIAASKLPELENGMLSLLSRGGGIDGGTGAAGGVETGGGGAGGALTEYGVEAISIGVTSLELPSAVTRDVFDRMNTNRTTIANRAIDQGKSEAASIRAKAENDARRITEFAERLSKEIRAQGDTEAAEFLKQMSSDPQLAVFLRNMELLRGSVGRSTTLVVPTSLPGFGFFRPDVMNAISPGQIPGLNVDMSRFPSSLPGTTPGSEAGGAGAAGKAPLGAATGGGTR